MKKLLAFSLISSTLLFGMNSVKSDDFTFTEGSTFTRESDTGMNNYLTRDGHVYTAVQDISCSDSLFVDNASVNGPVTAWCIQQIINKNNNLGKAVQTTAAMNTAMSTLPSSSPDSKYTCGLGTGGSSGTYAISAGCSSNITEKLTVNTGGSLALADSQDYGSGNIDNYGLKVGFLYKFGESAKPNLISNKKLKELENKIATILKNNIQIQKENNLLKEQIIVQNNRLENIERIAISETQSEDLASIKLP